MSLQFSLEYQRSFRSLHSSTVTFSSHVSVIVRRPTEFMQCALVIDIYVCVTQIFVYVDLMFTLRVDRKYFECVTRHQRI